MLLNDRLTQAMAAALRHHTSLAVLFVDVDHFKPINDAQGHAVGDALLKSISRRLIACVRTTDTVSRHGGDEFVVLLSEVTRKEDATVSAEKILTALRIPHRILEKGRYGFASGQEKWAWPTRILRVLRAADRGACRNLNPDLRVSDTRGGTAVLQSISGIQR